MFDKCDGIFLLCSGMLVNISTEQLCFRDART